MYAGLRQSVLGENMCDAVIDGSAELAERHVLHARREPLHEGAGGDRRDAGDDRDAQANAAYAGRAAARVFLGKWTEAVTDAGQVAIAFVYNMPYFNIGNDDQRNRIFWASATRARRLCLSRPHAVEHLVLRLPRGDE